MASILGRPRRDHPPHDVRALIGTRTDRRPTASPLPSRGCRGRTSSRRSTATSTASSTSRRTGPYNPDDPSHSGILIGPDKSLTATTSIWMPVIPELFLSICRSGRVGAQGVRSASANRLAASAARSLLLIGVRAVVAAGWAVDDRDAEASAATFYGRLLDDGVTFGETVTSARRAATRTNTWAAYQCYGDPGYRLR